jgi:DNA-directed RNA polymerase I, II, and III subunit RPABC2
MSYFEDDKDNNGSDSELGSDANSGSDSDAGSDAGSEYNASIVKPKSVISLEEDIEGEGDNGSEIADSDMDDDDDDDLAEGLEDDDEEEDGEEGDKGDKEKDVIVEDGEEEITLPKKTKKVKIDSSGEKKIRDYHLDEEDDDDDETGELYLKKFDKEINDNYLLNFHPECALHNYDEVLALSKVIRDKFGIIVDDLHKTVPFITKYERARVLGQRAKQINSGATVFVRVPENVLDGYLIAELELIEKRIPFIIRRPLPNGGSEYWSIKDLENISF